MTTSKIKERKWPPSTRGCLKANEDFRLNADEAQAIIAPHLEQGSKPKHEPGFQNALKHITESLQLSQGFQNVEIHKARGSEIEL